MSIIAIGIGIWILVWLFGNLACEMFEKVSDVKAKFKAKKNQ